MIVLIVVIVVLVVLAILLALGFNHLVRLRNETEAGWSNIDDQGHLMLKASRRLMDTPALAGGTDEGRNGLFEACNTISTLKYEGKEGVGRIVIARRGHPSIRVDLTLTFNSHSLNAHVFSFVTIPARGE